MQRNFLFQPWLAPLLRQRWVCRVLLGVVLLVFIAFTLGWGLWPCPVARFLDLPCPGCGLTRSLTALMRGHLHEMLRLHPFAPFAVLMGGLVTLGAALPARGAVALADRVEKIERRTGLVAIIFLLFTCFGLLRLLGLWYYPPMPEPILPWKRTMEGAGL
ncbi:MAG: DUF2752 domain-containing protein [Verrucomicrobiaceae bacterium]|nr:DUF2752 domain-containing protein [Verrucomicrobiaceae bacterium]